ncbi:hypothetical protein DERP_007925 [Dermatophagoides pteronyssinus]|uniref:Uncharacterized protein n=1 Tax=Dermatophagoides pteronyssinus TaxID=6956 RepID=A0ABQ8IT08_DERPT|nr:hypothetical protein DERP_007925 [Dermatophagoides pteronyssinus]
MWILLQNCYLYSRIYYNKICDQANYWWQTYLLFKCCLLVIPIYSFLLLIGAYCIWYNIDVQTSIKTIYELLILLFSAAAIFIIVLLLATLNGQHNPPTLSSSIDNYDQEIQISNDLSMSSTRRHHLDDNFVVDDDDDLSTNDRQKKRRSNYLRNQQQRQRRRSQSTMNAKSIASNLMTTLFGNFNDPDYCYGSDSDSELVIDPIDSDLLIAAAANDNPELLMETLNSAQSQLFTEINQTANNLEYFIENLSDERNIDIDDDDRILGYRIRNDDNDLDDDDYGPQQIIANPLLESTKLTSSSSSAKSSIKSFPTLIPPMMMTMQPPNYSEKSFTNTANNNNIRPIPLSPSSYMNINENNQSSNVVLQMTIQNDDDDDRPPSYEEAIGSNNNNKFL